MVKETELVIHKEEAQMVVNQMKGCSASLGVSQVQIKTMRLFC